MTLRVALMSVEDEDRNRTESSHSQDLLRCWAEIDPESTAIDVRVTRAKVYCHNSVISSHRSLIAAEPLSSNSPVQLR